MVQETNNRGVPHEACVNYMQNLTESSVSSLTKGTSAFTLIERARLDDVLAELRLSYLGILQGGAPEVGKLTGVNYILFTDMIHHVTDEETTEIATAKLVRVKTGEIIVSQIIYSGVTAISKPPKERE